MVRNYGIVVLGLDSNSLVLLSFFIVSSVFSVLV